MDQDEIDITKFKLEPEDFDDKDWADEMEDLDDFTEVETNKKVKVKRKRKDSKESK